MRNISLFDSLEDARRTDWRPDTPPLIASKGIKKIQLNWETSGLRWFEKDRPISASVRLPDGSIHFLPFGFRGGNLDEATVKRWAQTEIKDLHIENINTRFEVHMGREWGVDFESNNCTVSDVSHYAALLDDHRQRFSLDALITDYLGHVAIPRLDESRMPSYHAEEAAARAKYQVQAVAELSEKMLPQIEEQDLSRVLELESKVIYPVCEMERNGAPCNVELLDHWLIKSQKKYEETLWKLVKMTGFQTDPNKPEHRARLFHHYKLPMEHLPSGRASFTDAILKEIDHPAIKLLRYAIKLGSLRSKYLLKYKRNIDSNGILRYSLHQLRSQKDPLSDYAGAGTVTGRFSSSEIVPQYGLNIQQEMKAAKQRVAFGYDEDDYSHDDELFIIRQLRIPRDKNRKWIAADAMQVEYRIFASYTGNKAVIGAYAKDPLMSFHKYMWEKIKPQVIGAGGMDRQRVWTYRQQKDLNFAYIYGAGLTKLALMLGHISKSEYDAIKSRRAYDDPKLLLTKEIRAIYKRELPEVETLLEEAAHLAKPACDSNCYWGGAKANGYKNPRLHAREPHRGYVKTILGRRSRFPDGDRLHKAFNSVDQGSGADIMKQKLVELHDERKHTGFLMCYTVHDEVDGEGDEYTRKKVYEILNRQSFPMLKVPIMWDVSIGANWAACDYAEPQFETSDEIRSRLSHQEEPGTRHHGG